MNSNTIVPTPTSQSRPDAHPARRKGHPATGRAGRRSLPERLGRAVADVCEIEVIDPAKVARARRTLPSAETTAALAEMLRALGDPTRLQIIAALATDGIEELCVCDLATLVGASRSAVSHSLRTLRQLRIVRYRKAGKIAYYTLDDSHVAQLVAEGVQYVESLA
ncbi:MAG: metalloregulator ArsR/SmtB family transcription factor [Gemmatimonadaceae bacterium]